MPYNRPEDQYKRNRSKEMIDQLQKENQKPKCTFSTVKIYRVLDFQGFKHAGTLSHICTLDKGHSEYCKCICGVEFQGFTT